MSALIHLTMLGWIPFVLVLFWILPPRRAVIQTLVLSVLFLPMAGYGLPALPDYTKLTATSFSLLLGISILDPGAFGRYRFSLSDIPMIAFCLLPMASSLSNGLGPYDGISSVLYQILTWGIPYVAGRLYFTSPTAIEDLAVGMVFGGMIYVPFCLYEIRFSPQLHRMIYGFHAHEFIQTKRFGGWRPTVFMQHGLMVGSWMTSATMTAFWLWRAKTVRFWGLFPMGIVVLTLLVTTVLCKSVGVLAMGIIAIGILWMTWRMRTTIALTCFVALYPGYLGARAVGILDGSEIIAIAKMIPIVNQRVGSLESRVMNEKILVEKTRERAMLGWASNFQVTDRNGKAMTTPDSMWILVYSRLGLAGLICWLAILMMPVVGLMRRIAPSEYRHPDLAAAAVLTSVVMLFAMDCMLNAMLIPFYLCVCGGLTGLFFQSDEILTDLDDDEYANSLAF